VKLYYSSDIHGSETCWRKFLNAGPFYNAKVIVMGGDLTGKGIVPIVRSPDGEGWRAQFKGRAYDVRTDEALAALEQRITFNGMYPYRCSQAELDELTAAPDQDVLFDQLMEETFARWLAIGDEKLRKSGVSCWVMPGNDDAWAIDRAFASSELVGACDRKVVDIGDGYSMLSIGYANPTPWNSPREVPEETLAAMIEELIPEVPSMDRAIFNLHVPPFDSDLDIAPKLDADFRIQTSGGQPEVGPVGSTAVRSAIERHQPLLALHGHIHESKGSRKIGRTVCINPGSSYSLGQLDGVLVELKGDRVKRFQFVIG
jgi:Icc-related predicted phosphoesterase